MIDNFFENYNKVSLYNKYRKTLAILSLTLIFVSMIVMMLVVIFARLNFTQFCVFFVGTLLLIFLILYIFILYYSNKIGFVKKGKLFLNPYLFLKRQGKFLKEQERKVIIDILKKKKIYTSNLICYLIKETEARVNDYQKRVINSKISSAFYMNFISLMLSIDNLSLISVSIKKILLVLIFVSFISFLNGKDILFFLLTAMGENPSYDILVKILKNEQMNLENNNIKNMILNHINKCML